MCSASIDHDDFVVVMERVTRAHLPRLQSLNELQLFATAVMGDNKNPLIQQFVDVVHAAIDESHKRCIHQTIDCVLCCCVCDVLCSVCCMLFCNV